MGKPRSTGNELFDIVWAEYPPRNGRKETKAESLVYWKKKKFSEEQAYDIVEWIKKDKESRESLRKQGKFCKEPKDFIRFLKKEVWGDEIGVEVTDSQRFEKKRSIDIYSKTVQGHINTWSKLIHEWPIDKLRKSVSFMSAYNAYSEFRVWVQKELPNREPAKPDHIVDANKKVEPPKKKQIKRLVMPSKREQPATADLPPPLNELEKILDFVHDVKKAKADGRIEQVVRSANLF